MLGALSMLKLQKWNRLPLALVAFLSLLCSMAVSALEHTPVTSIGVGQRAIIKVNLGNSDQVKLARVYFRGNLDSKYNFVVLNHQGGGIYTAELPAPGKSLTQIDYRIVTQASDGAVSKSPKYSIAVTATGAGSGTAVAAGTGFIQVYSELPRDLSADNSGFDDNIRPVYNAARVSGSAGEMAFADGGSLGAGASAAAGGAAVTASQVGYGVAGVVGVGLAASSSSSKEKSSNDSSTVSGGSSSSSTDASADTPSTGSGSLLSDLTGVPCAAPDYVIKWDMDCIVGGSCPPFDPPMVTNMSYHGYIKVANGREAYACYIEIGGSTPVPATALFDDIVGFFGGQALCSNQVSSVQEYNNRNFKIVEEFPCASEQIPVIIPNAAN